MKDSKLELRDLHASHDAVLICEKKKIAELKKGAPCGCFGLGCGCRLEPFTFVDRAFVTAV